MATSTAKTTGYSSGEDPATIEANLIYQDALAKLSQSLDTRKNRFFDPVWLAAAQGFLAPTQTGGFGESLGNAAKSISAAQAEDIKQEQAINEQRVAAAGKGVDLQRMRARDADIAKWLQGDQSGPIAGPQAGPLAGPLSAAVAGSRAASPVGGPLTTSVPPEPAVPDVAIAAPVRPPSVVQPSPLAPVTTAQVASPSGSEDDGGVQIFPANPNFPTAREYVNLNRNSGRPLGELIKEGIELERRNLEVKESGTTNLRTGKFYASKAVPVDVQIFGDGYNGATFKVPESVALQLGVLQRQGNEAGYKALADKFTGRTFGRPAGAPPVTGGSVEDRVIANTRAVELAKAETALEIESRKDFNQRKKDADETITMANVFRRFSSEPNAKDMFGILSNDKVMSGVATLVRDGIGLPGFTVGTKSIEDVMRNAGLSDADQAKYRTFLMYTAQMQLQQTKYMKGAVSDFEQRLMGSAGITNQDTPETIRTKADLLTRRAQFDRRVAKAFKDSKMTADDFLDSDKYNEMRDKYNVDLSELATGNKILVAPPAVRPPSGPAAPVAPSPGFTRDPKTGVIRRKLPGE
tara:strand:+ start:2624 stop:4360 length:1737 start_codon:yes stop_codon:yes gene_type:complete